MALASAITSPVLPTLWHPRWEKSMARGRWEVIKKKEDFCKIRFNRTNVPKPS